MKACPFCGAPGTYVKDHDRSHHAMCLKCDVGFCSSSEEAVLRLWERRQVILVEVDEPAGVYAAVFDGKMMKQVTSNKHRVDEHGSLVFEIHDGDYICVMQEEK